MIYLPCWLLSLLPFLLFFIQNKGAGGGGRGAGPSPRSATEYNLFPTFLEFLPANALHAHWIMLLVKVMRKILVLVHDIFLFNFAVLRHPLSLHSLCPLEFPITLLQKGMDIFWNSTQYHTM